jgi:SAM-dependent methyltransferase
MGLSLAERGALRLRRWLLRAGWLLRGRPGAWNCPACSRTVPEFEPLPAFFATELARHGYPFGLDEAETLNARQYTCPWCGASDRDRLCALYLEERLAPPLPRRLRFLDFAPSPSLSRLFRAREDLEYRTADIAMPAVDHRVDLMALPFPDGHADVFMCSHVLEHVPDDRRALRELRRILRPDGFGVLLVPIVLTLPAIDEETTPLPAAERWRRFGQDDHVRLYNRDGFVERVRQAGFAVSALGSEHFGAERLERHGITTGSRLYVVERAP